MNRKERRAARSNRAGGGALGTGPGALRADLFASAVARFNAGQLDEAERLCRDVLMFDKGHFDALSMLGIIATRAGNLQAAIELYDRALAVNGRSAECHFNLGQALRAQGRDREAMAHFGEATAIKRDYVAAHIALAEILRLQGHLDEAANRYRQVVALRPDYAEAISNLGVVFAAQGHFPEAAEQYRRALTIKPGLVDTYRNLARALLADGQADEALAAVIRGLAIGETDEAKVIFVQCAQSAANAPPGEAFRGLVVRALSEGWGRSAELSPLACSLFMSERGRIAVDGSESAAGSLASLSGDQLLRALLESAPARNHDLERVLTASRSDVLRMATHAEATGTFDEETLAFVCALARQCFINEYVFAETDADAIHTATLRDRISAALTAGAPVSPMWLAALGCFMPLHSLTQASLLPQRAWPEAINALLVQQVREPAVERDIRATILSLTAIDNAVSIKVRNQYEEMPYPRWVKPSSLGQPTPINWYLRSQFPDAPMRPVQHSETLDVLIAGCGTGQHATETAQRFAGARVLAIDLSRSSLAYAVRKSREAHLHNIEYRQADILNLGALNARFDVIESSGVLHYLHDPLQGWRVLVSLLRTGGVMHIGLYSAAARADIRTTRAFITERGYRATAADIRRYRQELLASEDGTPFKNATRYGDFFTTSECRDLLFHVQEHQFSIPEIKAFIGANGLTFLGFTGPVAQAYRARFPDDPAMTDLDRWHTFETENPMAFVNMYQFWVQKN